MRPVGHRSDLADLLSELPPLAPRSADDVAELRRQLREDRLRVLVVGEAKRGKSTLVNALLSRPALPTGVTPLTAVPTTVAYGTPEAVEATFTDQNPRGLPLGELAGLVTEPGNPSNRKNVTRVVVRLDARLLAEGVEIVDTPGTGSVHAHNTQAAESALETMDVAVFVLTVDPPISDTERALLGRVAELSVTTFYVLNKIDYLDTTEREEAEAFTRGVLEEAVGHPVIVHPCSARGALNSGGDPGFARFHDDFRAYLRDRRSRDLRASVAARASRLAASALDDIRVTLRATELSSGEAAGRVSAFRERLAAVDARRGDAGDLVRGEHRRLLSSLNASAERAVAGLTSRIRGLVRRRLDDDLAEASPDEVERRGREYLVRLTREEVEAWRAERASELGEGLRGVDARLVQALLRELSELREAARDLLDLGLTAAEQPDRLVDNPRFRYAFAEDPGQTELLAGAVRRHLPGDLGRRRARKYVLDEVDRVVPKQIGRARSDFQYRLGESAHRLEGEIGRRYARSVDHLEAALDEASRLAAATESDAALRRNELGRREKALDDLVARLAEVM
ncbi:MAG: dynamin family protein [Streptosporangiaceae bacterium]